MWVIRFFSDCFLQRELLYQRFVNITNIRVCEACRSAWFSDIRSRHHHHTIKRNWSGTPGHVSLRVHNLNRRYRFEVLKIELYWGCSVYIYCHRLQNSCDPLVTLRKPNLVNPYSSTWYAWLHLLLFVCDFHLLSRSNFCKGVFFLQNFCLTVFWLRVTFTPLTFCVLRDLKFSLTRNLSSWNQLGAI